jgi:hypothetical protein
MQKNVAGQTWTVFAFDRTDNTPKTGDLAQITAKLSKDGAAAVAMNDASPVELESGYYEFTLTQAETNYDKLTIIPVSSTGDVQVVGSPGTESTDPVGFPDDVMRGTDGVDTSAMRGTDGVDTAAMRGTDSAALASVLGAAVNADISADIAAVKSDTAGISAIPTTAMRGTDGANTTVPDAAGVAAIKTKQNTMETTLNSVAVGNTNIETKVDTVISTGDAGPWTTGGGGDATEAKQNEILDYIEKDEVFDPPNGTVTYYKKGTVTPEIGKKNLKDPAGDAVDSTEDIIAESREV